MARTTKPLTNTQVSQAKAKDKVYSLSDGGGLQLRIKPNGSKLWLLDYYHPHTKKRTSLSFGSYPSLSLADARKARDNAKALLAKEIDPKENREEERAKTIIAHNNSLEHVASLWMQTKRSKVSENHAEDTWRSLELHIFPNLGKTPIHKITAIKTIDTLNPIAAKGSLETIKRLCQRLNEIMTFAVNTGLIEANPLSGIKAAFGNPDKQHLPTLKPEQLPYLISALSNASIKKTTHCLIYWQLHTMVRPSEAAGTRWTEIDFENRLWNIPPERMKSKKAHTIPLTEQSLEILASMKPISGKSEFVFPSDRDLKKHTHPSTANMALKRMGFHGELVAHGLRSIASTTLNEEGFDPDLIESALAHTGKNEVRNAYNRADYLKRRKPMMDWWSNHITNAFSIAPSTTGKQGFRLVQA